MINASSSARSLIPFFAFIQLVHNMKDHWNLVSFAFTIQKGSTMFYMQTKPVSLNKKVTNL
jgi:hypothetical protein